MGCTENFEQEIEKLKKLSTSPFIPSKIAVLIENFEKTVNDNLNLVQATLDEIAQLLPDEFKELDSLKNVEEYSLYSKFKTNYKDLEPKALEISMAIRKYLKTDEIYK